MRDLTIFMDLEQGRPADIAEGLAAKGVPLFAHGATVARDREGVVVPAGYPGGVVAVARKVADAGATVNVAYLGGTGDLVLSTTDISIIRLALGLD